jgi:hypothetical protein
MSTVALKSVSLIRCGVVPSLLLCALIPLAATVWLRQKRAPARHGTIFRVAERGSVIASNESFSGWAKTFTDPRLCAAIIDRLTFGGTIIETGTQSYRLTHTQRQPEHATS